MAIVFLIIHSVFAFVFFALSQYVVMGVFMLLGVYFYVAFHPVFFFRARTTVLQHADRARDGVSGIWSQLVVFVREYSLSVAFGLFYLSVFGIARSIEWISYDMLALGITLTLFAATHFLRESSLAEIFEEFFRANILFFSGVYVITFISRIISLDWRADPVLFLNVASTIAWYLFIIAAHRFLSTRERTLFVLACALYAMIALAFFLLNAGFHTGFSDILFPDFSFVMVHLAGFFSVYAVAMALLVPRHPLFGRYRSALEKFATITWSGSLFVLTGIALFGSADSRIPALIAVVPVAIVLARFFLHSLDRLALVALYTMVFSLFFDTALPIATDMSDTALLNTGDTQILRYAFAIATVFLLSFLELSLCWSALARRSYFFFVSLIATAIASSLFTLAFLAFTVPAVYIDARFLSFAVLFESLLFFLIAIRVRSYRKEFDPA